MTADLSAATRLLNEGGFTCVLCKEDEFLTSSERGVRPLVEWLKANADVKGYSAADKVVGKATAFLYVLLGVSSVYANVISKPALEVLSLFGISVQYSLLVPGIINRSGTGACPFEAAVMDVDLPERAFGIILKKLATLSRGDGQ